MSRESPRVPGHLVGSKVARALGLDPHRVKKVELVVEPNQAAFWRVEVFYRDDEESLLGADIDLREPSRAALSAHGERGHSCTDPLAVFCPQGPVMVVDRG